MFPNATTGKLVRGLAGLGILPILAIVLFGCEASRQRVPTSTGQAGKVYAYIPCGMREPFDHAIRMFNAAHPDTQLQAYYDNAVILVRKIKAGDRPDLFISPGEVEMRILVEAGLINPASVTDIGTYTLALLVPRGNPAKVKSLADLAKPSVRAIAVGEPRENSVGYYAKQSLEHFGLWEKVKGKVISPEHALDVVTFAAMGRVDAALAYETCPLQSAPEKASKERVEIIREIPADSHSPIVCKIGVLRQSRNPVRAREFAQFLTTEQVQAVFQETGLPRLSNLVR